MATIVLSSLAAQDNPLKFSLGGGVSWLFNSNDQQFTVLGVTGEAKTSYGSFGINGFFDLTQYFTLKLGYRMVVGDEAVSFSIDGLSSSSTVSSTVSQFEIGGELKYPLRLSQYFSLAPKIGLDDLMYLGGLLDGSSLNSDGKTILSPLLLTLGLDLNFNITDQVFIRIPLDLGFGLNAKLSDSYYQNLGSAVTSPSVPGSYSSSSDIIFKPGLELGYTF